MSKLICSKCGGPKTFSAKLCRPCRNVVLKTQPETNSNYKHGLACPSGAEKGRQSKTYMVWGSMVQRCENPKNKQYEDYGGRGIRVCEEWLDFRNFLRDMGEKPHGLELDRINNNKGYSKENCRWATSQENNRNRRVFKNKTSKYKGVHFRKDRGYWGVSITLNKKRYGKEGFKCEESAHKYYLKLWKELNERK